MDRICVFAGSGAGNQEAYRKAAQRLGEALAGRGAELVYGGGHTGLMGHLADAALGAGGRVVGIIPEALRRPELAHEGVTRLEVVATMHERKQRMAELADAFIALPGGIGTLEELCEIVTWAQLGLHAKPCGLLNAGAYYDPLIAFLDAMVAEGFLRPGQRDLLHEGEDPEALLAAFASAPATPTGAPRIGPGET